MPLSGRSDDACKLTDDKESLVAKYLVLFKAGGPGHEQTGEPTVAEHKAWVVWKDDTANAIIDFGGPTIAVPGGGGSDIVGYSIMQADTLDALDAVFETNPHRKQGGVIEFHEILEMPDA